MHHRHVAGDDGLGALDLGGDDVAEPASSRT
jgi:hypothetical protein